MWSFHDDDAPGLLGASKVNEFVSAVDITPETLRSYVDRAERMRAEAMAHMLRTLATAVARPFRRNQHGSPTRKQAMDDCRTRVECDLKTPITSIRASAEILRDHTEVAVEERNRFLEAILEESRRLEKFAERLLDRMKPHMDKRTEHRRANKRDGRLERQVA